MPLRRRQRGKFPNGQRAEAVLAMVCIDRQRSLADQRGQFARGHPAFEIHLENAATATPPLVTAKLVYVNADPEMKPAPLPEELREKVRRYERIEPQS